MYDKSNGICIDQTNALETLYSGIILGLNFLSQHQRLIFEFCRASSNLMVSNE